MTEPIARIEAALARLGAEHEPPVGWEARVLAATAAPAPRRWWWWLGAPLVVAIALLVWLVPRGPNNGPVKLAYAIIDEEPGHGPTRGEPGGNSARLGQTLRITAPSRGSHREIRVYREDQLEVGCPGDAVCHGADSVDIKLSRSGRYRILWLTASGPIPPPVGSFDADLAAVRNARVEIDQRPDLIVD